MISYKHDAGLADKVKEMNKCQGPLQPERHMTVAKWGRRSPPTIIVIITSGIRVQHKKKEKVLSSKEYIESINSKKT
jgi:hypothetical protein